MLNVANKTVNAIRQEVEALIEKNADVVFQVDDYPRREGYVFYGPNLITVEGLAEEQDIPDDFTLDLGNVTVYICFDGDNYKVKQLQD